MSIPDHKLIPGTGFIVDGFKYQSPVIQAYLLSHAHSDHYGGITDNWDRGPIYCSAITGRLIVHMLGIKPEYVHELPMDTPCMLQDVEVTLVDANHCPGAVQFLFRLSTGEKYVHCGDMRFSPKLLDNPLLAAYRNCTAVYLDTTYCNPRFTFPPQEESVEYVAATIERMVQESKDGGQSRLYMVSTYGIGKERILAEVHRRCGFKVFVSERKLGVMQCLELPGLDIDDLFCRDPTSSPLHVVTWGYLGDTWPFFKPNFVNMEQARVEAGVDEVIGFVPTGWMYEMKRKAFPVRHKGKCWIHLVPYSEHSSYNELRDYVRWLKPQKVIPTVGVGGDDSDKKNAAMLKHFRNLVDETASKARFLSTFQRVSTPSSDLDSALGPATSSAKSMDLDVSHADSEQDGQAMEQLMAVVGESLEREAARQLLQEADGDVGRAINFLYDRPTAAAAPAAAASAGAQASGSAQSQSRQGRAPKRKGPAAPAGPLQGALGRPSGASNAFAAPAAKRSKPPPAASKHGQKSISSFFGGAEQARQAASQSSPDACMGGPSRETAQALHPAEPHSRLNSETRAAPGGATQPQMGAGLFGQKPAAAASGGAQQELASPTAVLSSLTEYDAVTMAPWKLGEKVPYLHIARAFQAIDGTTKRLRIGDTLANMFRSILALSPEDMLPAVYLTCGKIAPEYENLELNVGGSTVAAAIVEATGAQRSRLREMYKEHGDLGDVAQACRHTQTILHRPAPLTVSGVFAALRQMAVEKGAGSAGRRQRSVLALLRSCRECETRYLVRTLVQNLRVGANWRSVIGALARAIVIHQQGPRVPKQRLEAAATAASAAFHQCPNLDILVPAMVDGGIDELEKRCALTPGVPLKPMLAKITEGIPDALKQLKGQAFLAEYKYDGQRAQIHLLPDRSVRLFSRNCEDKTAAFPDVVEAVQRNATDGINGLVLDAELVAVDRSDGKLRLRAFQELSTRARGGVTTDQVTIHVCVFVFDLLYVDGESLVHLPLRARREHMATSLSMQPGYLEAAQALEFPPHLTASGAPAIESAPIRPQSTHPTGPRYEASPAAAAAVTHPACVRPENSIELGLAELQPKTPPAQPGTHESGMAEHLHEKEEGGGAARQALDPHEGHRAGEAIGSDAEDLSGGDEDLSGQSGEDSEHGSDADHAEKKRGKDGTAAPSDGHLAGEPTLPPKPATAMAMTTASAGQELEDEEPEQRSRADQLQELLLESFAAGMEGLMLKTLDAGAAYQPSKRSDSWVKLKRDYCEGLRDSLDLVPIGAWYGQGRKVNWFSPFLMAAWDPEREEFQSVCRCMSGFTDVFYAEATARFKAQQLPERKPYYVTAESPSVWFEPTEVWEIRGADLTISPVHKAAVGHLHPDRGVSLRFPRYIRTRDDKRAEDATGPEVICELYQKQTRKMETAQEALQKSKPK
ncbi:hypothetical protein WJX84_011403 [Apatococcus fuscideae]|uniref:DNA ligase n=1 Tax=Apatococcus fuscideae TaxID=2026836 RepID=A0AAW1T7N8_9CHLO